MNRSESEHLAQFSKEALELISEFNETDRLMREQRWEELMVHIHEIFQKYLFEASLHNLIYPYPPCTPQQAGENCKHFLRGLLFAKAGEAALRTLSS